VRLATASRTSGHSRSAGCNSGVQLGRKWSTTLAGTTSRLAVCPPALSTTSTSTFSPPGSAPAANATSASPMPSALYPSGESRRWM
jgi:hypothetical protein